MTTPAIEVVELSKRFRTRPRNAGFKAALRELFRASHQEQVAVDALLVAAGRTPNVDDLGLEAAGVRTDRQRGVVVDDNLRTTNPSILAAGEVGMAHKFTHAADAQGHGEDEQRRRPAAGWNPHVSAPSKRAAAKRPAVIASIPVPTGRRPSRVEGSP